METDTQFSCWRMKPSRHPIVIHHGKLILILLLPCGDLGLGHWHVWNVYMKEIASTIEPSAIVPSIVGSAGGESTCLNISTLWAPLLCCLPLIRKMRKMRKVLQMKRLWKKRWIWWVHLQAKIWKRDEERMVPEWTSHCEWKFHWEKMMQLLQCTDLLCLLYVFVCMCTLYVDIRGT